MADSLTIGCSKMNLGKVRAFVAQTLSAASLSDVERHKLVLAVDEICANLIIHSNSCNPSKRIEVIIDSQSKSQLVFTIRDEGNTFDISSYSEPSMDEIVSSRRKGGVGLMLVRRIMDKIEFTTEKNCNICRLTKILNE